MERGETLSEAFGRNETRVELYTYRARMESLAENREKANAALDAARALASQLGLGPESIPTRRIKALQTTIDSAEKG